MFNRLHSLEISQLERLHKSCIYVLEKIGITFHDNEALDIFRKNNFQLDGNTVYFTENQVMDALKTVPREFSIQARNPKKSVTIGGDNTTVLSPGWGAPFVIDSQGQRRSPTQEDLHHLCKLAQTSPYLDMASSSMVIPEDLSSETATAEMLASYFTLTDLPLTTNACSRKSAQETVDISAIVWGNREAVTKDPVSIVSVNPLTPLAYSPEAAGGLIEFARNGQALLISSMVLAGITGPITLAGSAVIEMAESLAGIVLAQLVRPGAPCVFGGTSTSGDLRLGNSVIGTPELIKFMGVSTQMAQFYGLPSRYGGGLTDSIVPDIQAGSESAMAIALSMVSGVHYMHQACGILATYTAMSFEKFVIDEEIGGFVKRAVEPVEITDESLGLDMIERNAGTGSFLFDPETLAKCRSEFFIPNVAQRTSYANWVKNGKQDEIAIARKHIDERVKAYQKPDMDPQIENDIQDYIQNKLT